MIDGKCDVKTRTMVFETNKFITYLYEFENGNKYKECQPKWKQTDFTKYVNATNEEKLDNHIDRILNRDGYIGKNTIMEDMYE